MTKPDETLVVEMVPIARISVPNPRVRSKVSFDQLVESISKVGLKKPITLTRRDDDDGAGFDLVCGQGRLEAYAALGQSEIPAIVEDVSNEDRMLRSVVENIARLQHRPLELQLSRCVQAAPRCLRPLAAVTAPPGTDQRCWASTSKS